MLRRTFAHFAAVVGDSPDQCIRYCFEEGAEPLWPSERHVPLPKDIPPCPHCSTPRRFEFQVHIFNNLQQQCQHKFCTAMLLPAGNADSSVISTCYTS